MTVLIGAMPNNNTVLITGDRKTTNQIHGENLDSFKTNKVHMISENLLVGIGGHTEMGIGIVQMLKSTFRLIHNATFDEMIKYIGKTARFSYDMFKEVHPDKSSDLLLMIAGLDIRNGSVTPRIEQLSSKANFFPQAQNNSSDIIVHGASLNNFQEVFNYLSQNMDKALSFNKPEGFLSAAIRSSDHELVSKDTFSIRIEYNHKEKRIAHYFTLFNEEGVEISPTPEDINRATSAI